MVIFRLKNAFLKPDFIFSKFEFWKRVLARFYEGYMSRSFLKSGWITSFETRFQKMRQKNKADFKIGFSDSVILEFKRNE